MSQNTEKSQPPMLKRWESLDRREVLWFALVILPLVGGFLFVVIRLLLKLLGLHLRGYFSLYTIGFSICALFVAFHYSDRKTKFLRELTERERNELEEIVRTDGSEENRVTAEQILKRYHRDAKTQLIRASTPIMTETLLRPAASTGETTPQTLLRPAAREENS